jgi:phosphoglycolate phosphatase
MAIKGIIFDLDGTLLDSLADIATSGNAVLNRRGRPPHSLEAYRGFIGNGMGALVRRAWGVADDANPPELPEILAEVRTEYVEHCMDQTRPYEGIVELLEQLRRREIAMSVLSNKPDLMTQAMTQRLLNARLFSSISGERKGVPRKPDPAGALRAAEFMGLPAHACAMVGDLSVDIETGKNAGMKAVAVTWGFADEPDLLATNPDFVARRPLDLLDLV